MQIRGYKSIAEFCRTVNLPYMTVVNQLKQGYCKWPRRIMKGQSSSPAYKCWENMVQRCTNSKATGYKYWGGRGISVCDRWRISFTQFIEDVGERPSSKHSLDRIDVDGNYEPGNVRWATAAEQNVNKQEVNLTNREIIQEPTGHKRCSITGRYA